MSGASRVRGSVTADRRYRRATRSTSPILPLAQRPRQIAVAVGMPPSCSQRSVAGMGHQHRSRRPLHQADRCSARGTSRSPPRGVPASGRQRGRRIPPLFVRIPAASVRRSRTNAPITAWSEILRDCRPTGTVDDMAGARRQKGCHYRSGRRLAPARPHGVRCRVARAALPKRPKARIRQDAAQSHTHLRAHHHTRSTTHGDKLMATAPKQGLLARMLLRKNRRTCPAETETSKSTYARSHGISYSR